jgi:hypothetical protein
VKCWNAKRERSCSNCVILEDGKEIWLVLHLRKCGEILKWYPQKCVKFVSPIPVQSEFSDTIEISFIQEHLVNWPGIYWVLHELNELSGKQYREHCWMSEPNLRSWFEEADQRGEYHQQRQGWEMTRKKWWPELVYSNLCNLAVSHRRPCKNQRHSRFEFFNPPKTFSKTDSSWPASIQRSGWGCPLRQVERTIRKVQLGVALLLK